MIKKFARWILRNEFKILPPAEVMMSLKHIFYQEDKDSVWAYSNAIKISDCYREEYDRCVATCKDIESDLNELREKEHAQAESEN